MKSYLLDWSHCLIINIAKLLHILILIIIIIFVKNMEIKVGKYYKLVRKIGSGAFGEIFHGINIKT